ncbi:rnf12-b [Symbiodinium sp. CCMP2592]|nr:rnf12-b [Symbiodinium sp. CCMP2592]
MAEEDGSASYSGSSCSRSRSRSAPRSCKLGIGALVEVRGLEKSVHLNDRQGVLTAPASKPLRWVVLFLDAKGEADSETQRVAVPEDKLQLVAANPETVRLRFRNVPEGYTSALMKEELEEEGFSVGDNCSGVVYDPQEHHCYVTAMSPQVARQIVANFDGRRLERCGPGVLPDSCLVQNVKLEWL